MPSARVALQGPKTGWTEDGLEDLVFCYGLLLGGLIQFLAGMWGESKPISTPGDIVLPEYS